jgi:hypothetical protein
VAITNGSANVRAAVVAGLAGNLAVSAYLSVALPVFFKTPPIALFQWDASNIIGSSAFRGGWSAAALGFFFDCLVAIGWGAWFVLFYRRVPAVRRSPALWGLLFGLVVMLVMFYLVVPLGRAQQSSSLPSLADALVAHTVFFGLPVALVASRILGSAGRRKSG